MAKASKAVVEVETVVVTKSEGITLELTMVEAQTLKNILALIGGSPETSERKHAAAISDALTKADLVDWSCDRMVGNIYCHDTVDQARLANRAKGRGR